MKIFQYLFFFTSCLLVFTPSMVDATIIIGDRHFQSMPAVFGKPFSLAGSDDTAHLQILQDNPFLCNQDKMSTLNERHLKRNKDKTKNNETDHVLPTDGLPVAVLVSRGACSFEEKARTAMTYDFIKYVIVYDDRSRSALVPMSATDPDDIDIGMLFVSHSTGIQMRRLIAEQPANVTKEGGMIITMDARSPPMPPDYNQTQQWMLAAMAGFFTFMACFGCLLVGIQTGVIPADGRIVIGRTGIHPAMSSRRYLTVAQVRRLPHETYVEGDDENHGCAICIEEYRDGETLQVLPCSHKFHSDCIIPWLTERQASCPLCKHDITEDDLMEEEGDEESRGARGWLWSWGRGGRTIVPTEDNDTFETPPGSPSRLEEHSPPMTPLSASEDNEEDTEAVAPGETS